MTAVRKPVQPARWLPATTDADVRAVIERALADVGLLETPPGSNRSGVIDEYLRAAGVPASEIEAGRGYWCAAAAGAWWQWVGWPTPTGYASCDNWLLWATRTNRLKPRPIEGALVLYGVPTDAQHIGLVVRTAPLVLSVEGNVGLGGKVTNNGVACTLKPVDRSDILGYVWPPPALLRRV